MMKLFKRRSSRNRVTANSGEDGSPEGTSDHTKPVGDDTQAALTIEQVAQNVVENVIISSQIIANGDFDAIPSLIVSKIESVEDERYIPVETAIDNVQSSEEVCRSTLPTHEIQCECKGCKNEIEDHKIVHDDESGESSLTNRINSWRGYSDKDTSSKKFKELQDINIQQPEASTPAVAPDQIIIEPRKWIAEKVKKLPGIRKRKDSTSSLTDSDDSNDLDDCMPDVITKFMDEHLKQQEHKDCQRKNDLCTALSSLLSLLYGGVLILLGFTFPLTEALRAEWMITLPASLFNLYIYLGSSAFLVYIYIYVWMKIEDKASTDTNQNIQPPSTGDTAIPPAADSPRILNEIPETGAFPSLATVVEDTDPGEWAKPYTEPLEGQATLTVGSEQKVGKRNTTSILHGGLSESISESSLNMCMDVFDQVYDELVCLQQTASLSHDGASFYLRVGALFFGMANAVYVVLQIDDNFRQIKAKCDNIPAVFPMFFHLLFLVLQTFCIFKTNKIHVKMHKSLARFGFAHVLATNMCTWLRILIFEVIEGVYIIKVRNLGNASTNDMYLNRTACIHKHGYYYSMAPYLFPFILEYSLIAAATMAGMYKALNMRVTQDILHAVAETVWQKRGNGSSRCTLPENMFDKSHRGMYSGSLMLAGALVSVIMFHFTLASGSAASQSTALELYYWCDLMLHVILIPPILCCAFKLRKFKFTFARENTIDDTLLLVSLGGLILYNLFIMFPSSSSVFESGSDILALWDAIINILQGVLQGVFVIAGLQLCAANKQQVEDKPGRGIIVFIIIGNVALWFFKTFLVEEVSLHRYVNFFGTTAWPIIMNTNLPLVMFYRFHVSVCLADMWASVYKPDTGPKYKTIQ